MYWVTPGAAMSPEMYSIPSLRERIERLGVTQLVDVRMAEEQEREADHEVEQERHIERPPKVQPARHVIHEDIREFVSTGRLRVSSGHISPLLAPLDMANALDSIDRVVSFSACNGGLYHHRSRTPNARA